MKNSIVAASALCAGLAAPAALADTKYGNDREQDYNQPHRAG
ncbi:hypothetical protein [Roseovarius arcticus]|nr:hypothetical protein [Roseovarius arcticus]